MPQATPVAGTDRLETLDVLRGFALLGILAMNIRRWRGPSARTCTCSACSVHGREPRRRLRTVPHFPKRLCPKRQKTKRPSSRRAE